MGFPAKENLNRRAAKSLTARVVKADMYLKGQTVNVVCQVTGGAAYGSTVWDKTTDGLWVADHHVKTGSDGFLSNMPRCDNDQPSTEDGGPPAGSGAARPQQRARHRGLRR
ncbi:hypothetical protein [Streptosporangium sp. V21-05]|uniref:hypothetical protein n=1 Tax=Streptosporangium sp. V21-05 TaxID=3446115 RepID=UPI003F53DC8D